ncbi:MAG: hypothetical protein B7Y36_17055 [Novosphingobium sp. 28-62-57]|nr:MAG: hypothetical protein B7Y36_17055 [Novosphingobium sp. 28-62-57]OZA30817.1 MAG: hypothetical protein B7X92_15555 [Novosphingobium sp. 17-62-9]
MTQIATPANPASFFAPRSTASLARAESPCYAPRLVRKLFLAKTMICTATMFQTGTIIRNCRKVR